MKLWQQDVFGELFYKALPLLVALIALIGGCCFAIFAPAESLDRLTAVTISLAGLLGTAGVAKLLVILKRRPSASQLCSLKRNTLMLLTCLSWLGGAGTGFYIFCVILR